MDREFLKGLGLTDEQIEAVMSAKGKVVQAEQSKAQSTETELEALRKQIAERDKDLGKLQKESGDNAALQQQLTELQAKYKQDTETLQQQIADLRLDSALSTEITKSRGRNAKAIKALIDRNKLKLKEDGTLEGLDLEAIRKSDPYLFESADESDTKLYGVTPGGAPEEKPGDAVAAEMQQIMKGFL